MAEDQHSRALYWRKAYEELVRQTGRDLNDGLGVDPRKKTPSPLSRATPTTGEVSDARKVDPSTMGDVSSLIAARCIAADGPLIDCPVCGAVDKERDRLAAEGEKPAPGLSEGQKWALTTLDAYTSPDPSHDTRKALTIIQQALSDPTPTAGGWKPNMEVANRIARRIEAAKDDENTRVSICLGDAEVAVRAILSLPSTLEGGE